ncbi:hypothetical protein ACFLQY_03680 [Verrucomicrobiota bacterium]
MAAEITAKKLLVQIRDEGVTATVQAYRRNLLSSRTLIELFENEPDRDARLFLASYPTVPSALIEWMLETENDDEVLCAIAQNPRTAQPLLIRMVESATPAVQEAMASNKQLGPRECDLLIESDAWTVRATLAANPILSTHQQAKLAGDSEPAVRLALTGNKRLDPDVAIKLSTDPSAIVRTQLLTKTKLDDAILQIWADSDDLEKQQLLLERKKRADSIDESLSLSTHPQIRMAALQAREPSPVELMGLAESDSLDDRLFVAELEKLPISMQRLLAQDPHPAVRSALAANPHIAEGVALHIISAGDPETCEKLAENAALTPSAITELCHHDVLEVLLRVAYRDDLTDAHLAIMINDRQSLPVIKHLAMQGVVFNGTDAAMAEQLSISRQPSLRAFAAHSKHLPQTRLLSLSRDPAESVRQVAEQVLQAREAEQQPDTETELPPKQPEEKTILNRIVNFFAE